MGFPWLNQVDPVIEFRKATWRHRLDEERLELLSAKKFAKAVEGDLYVFGLILMPAGKAPEARWVGAIDTSDEGSRTLPPDKYLDMAYVFSKEAAGVLPEYHTMEHRIDLEPGTQPLYGPVYALSEKELEVL